MSSELNVFLEDHTEAFVDWLWLELPRLEQPLPPPPQPQPKAPLESPASSLAVASSAPLGATAGQRAASSLATPALVKSDAVATTKVAPSAGAKSCAVWPWKLGKGSFLLLHRAH
jgi:hypothetical protein